jgi:mannose-6-phosphate isomerase
MVKLATRFIEKPWGRTGLPTAFAPSPEARIGEVWFEMPPGVPETSVMIKYLFTSERLSIQVHPNDAQARALGHRCGKEEMWIVLDAEEDARIGLGLTRSCDADELRSALLDGSIETLVDWRPVRRGDVIYNPAGTIHAAGAGLALLEIQQSVDLTYRLYDYGRPRALHIEEGLAVADGRVHADPRDGTVGDRSAILVEGPHFGVAWCFGGLPAGLAEGCAPYQFIPLAGTIRIDGETARLGECHLLNSLAALSLAPDARGVLAWPVSNGAAPSR